MRVSFVVPTLNQAPFLRRCLESCLAQGVPDAEVVVVDGGSADGTRAILEGYGPRVRWTSEPDRGQSDALNKGVAAARGDVIAWINSDDYYPDGGCLRAVLEAMEADSRRDVVYGDVLLVDGEGRELRVRRADPVATAKDLLLLPAGATAQPGIFFRREQFLAVGGVATELHYAMDYDLWLRLWPRARAIHRLERVVAAATYHAGTKSMTGMLRQVRELRALKRAHRGAFTLSTPEAARMHLGTASLYAYWAAVRLGLWRAA